MIAIMFIIGLFIVMGIFLINGKGAPLIAGFNTKSSDVKAKYDTVALSKFMGKIMFALSFSMLFWVFGDVYGVSWLLPFGFVLFIAISVFTLVYISTGNRFKK